METNALGNENSRVRAMQNCIPFSFEFSVIFMFVMLHKNVHVT